jgi:hypothetical protein
VGSRASPDDQVARDRDAGSAAGSVEGAALVVAALLEEDDLGTEGMGDVSGCEADRVVAGGREVLARVDVAAVDAGRADGWG